MAYKCHKCEAPILVLRLGYCGSCREPISSEILPESKKKALAADEREYEEIRDRIRAQKGNSNLNRDGGSLFDLSDISNIGDYFN
jgi:hypothetical protein